MDLDFESFVATDPFRPGYSPNSNQEQRIPSDSSSRSQKKQNNASNKNTTTSRRKQYFRQRSQQLYNLSKHYTQGMFRSSSCSLLDDHSLWLLGKRFDPAKHRKGFTGQFQNLLWFTYRRNFKRIGDSHYTSDAGWGCMMRTGQMLLAEALRRKIDPNRTLNNRTLNDSEFDPKILSLLTLFKDDQSVPFSIHAIAKRGKSYEKEIGDWFGPGTMAHVMRDLIQDSPYRDNVQVYVSPMHGTLYINQVLDMCLQFNDNNNNNNDFLKNSENDTEHTKDESYSSCGAWTPVIILVPLRVGIDSFNTSYQDSFLQLFQIPQTLGVMGGRPRHSVYFVGHQDNDVFYLDPHSVQDTREETSIKSYHCQNPRKMNITNVDPSCAAGFYCHTEEDFREVCSKLRSISNPVISVQEAPPDHSQIPNFDMSDDEEEEEEEEKDHLEIDKNDHLDTGSDWVNTEKMESLNKNIRGGGGGKDSGTEDFVLL